MTFHPDVNFEEWDVERERRLKRNPFQYEEKQYLLFIEWHNNRLEQLKSEKYFAGILQ